MKNVQQLLIRRQPNAAGAICLSNLFFGWVWYAVCINGSQLAKMKKSIPDMSLP